MINLRVNHLNEYEKMAEDFYPVKVRELPTLWTGSFNF